MTQILLNSNRKDTTYVLLLQGKAGLPYDPFPSPMNGGCRDHMFAEGQGCSKQRSPNGPPNTFPLRLKSDTRVLTKSASVPENIKPGEFVKRGWLMMINIFDYFFAAIKH